MVEDVGEPPHGSTTSSPSFVLAVRLLWPMHVRYLVGLANCVIDGARRVAVKMVGPVSQLFCSGKCSCHHVPQSGSGAQVAQVLPALSSFMFMWYIALLVMQLRRSSTNHWGLYRGPPRVIPPPWPSG